VKVTLFEIIMHMLYKFESIMVPLQKILQS